MKMPKNVNIKLQNVPIENRVHCYDATIIIDFLNRTFMPLPYFVKPEVLQQIGSSKKPEMQDMKNPSNFLDNFIQISKMYEYYVLFRNQMDYTTPVETSWRFGLIIKKLLYPKNGWQFNVRRSGRAQIWQAGPVMLRVQATAEDKNNFKVAKATVQEVEVTPEDMNEEEDIRGPEPASPLDPIYGTPGQNGPTGIDGIDPGLSVNGPTGPTADPTLM